MAKLTDAGRVRVWERFMRENTLPLNVTKPELRAAFNGADDYLDANAAAMKAALPQPARAELANAQISYIYRLIMQERFEEGA